MSKETKIKVSVLGMSAILFFAAVVSIIFIAGKVGAADKTLLMPNGATYKDIDLGSHYARAVYTDDYKWYKMFNTGSPAGFAVTSDLYAVMIDASDSTNFPHGTNTHFYLKDFTGTACLDADTGVWEIKFGIITEQDGTTSGSVYWFDSFLFSGKGCEQFPKSPNHYPSMGIDTTYSVAGVPTYFTTGSYDADSVTFGDSVTYANLISGTSKMGLGDVILKYDEIVDGAGIMATLNIVYRADSN